MFDSTPLLETLWSNFRWVIPILLIIKGIPLAFKARAQGWIGERSIARDLEGITHAALHDVIIPDGRGGLTQIDHLLLTDSGIFVVETKTLTGRVFGQARDRSWTQRFGRRSFKIGNPLHQNFGHVQAVKALVGDAVPVSGQVVIAGSAEFPKGRPAGVYGRREFQRIMTEGYRGCELDPGWRSAWRHLKDAASQDRDSARTHRKQLQNRFGHDLRPAIGLALIASGIILAAWFYLD